MQLKSCEGRRAVLVSLLGAGLCWFVGCSRPAEIKPDSDPAKKEIQKLNEARQKEWGGKK